MRKIGIGVSDFKDIIEQEYFYVDKTKFIEEISENGAIVQLITRPRRFGKTLNMSMLRYFYDISGKDTNRKLFKNLYIENSATIKEQGKYPVIFISFKDIKALTIEEMYSQVRTLISEIYDNYKFLRKNLDERDRVIFDKIWTEDKSGNYFNSLKQLAKYLKEYYNQDVIPLIDEYDTPMVSLRKMVTMMR